jgi:hypothetical protein
MHPELTNGPTAVRPTVPRLVLADEEDDDAEDADEFPAEELPAEAEELPADADLEELELDEPDRT